MKRCALNLFLSTSILLLASTAWADDESENFNFPDPTNEQIAESAQPPKLESNVFDTGKIVRRRLLYRSTRFEIQPFFGLTVNDGYFRNLMPGVNLSYHLTNDLGFSFSFAYSVYHWETDLHKEWYNALSVVPGSSPQAKAFENTEFMKLAWFTDLGLHWVPLYGKFSLFNSATVSWDFHLIGGVAVLMQQVSDNRGTIIPEKESVLKGIRPGGLLQAGVRFYLNDFMSLNTDVRNFIYSSSDVSFNNKDSAEFTDRVFVSVGLSFFLPPDVKISW